MGLETTLKFTCDFPGCKGSQNGPSVVQYIKEEVEASLVPAPEEAKYMVFLNHEGKFKTFCGQLHAALYFLPQGYEEPVRKKVEAITPEARPVNGLTCKCQHPISMHNEYGCLIQLSNKPGDFCHCSIPGPKEAA